ncbi:hypothetical protein OG802_01615 [Streptomyces sp. NBC_00704]|uniref:hypothetical protein n=1 Tax=Streptomyces sp. NBC_00704 TaxID=2975809 RepID=UPI002E333640|nr:hypothetical protein [Streptomyces sp. NBC_00704]
MVRKSARPSETQDVEAALDELYAAPPSEFVPLRERLALAARTGGRPQDARRLHAARRPTLAAWAANLLLRAREQESRRFLELGRALREAYGNLDAQGIRELSEQRRSVVSALSRQAAELAAEAGHRLSDAARQDVEATLRAVLADQDAADRWAAGRLESALTPPSEFPSVTGAATGGPARAGSAKRPPGSSRSDPPEPSPRSPRSSRSSQSSQRSQRSQSSRRQDELAERRRRRREQEAEARRASEAADRRLGDLRAALAGAEDELHRAQDRQDRARRQHADAGQRLHDAERDLRRAEREMRQAEQDLHGAEQERRTADERRRAAADAVTAAGREARDAERKLRRLTGPQSGPG